MLPFELVYGECCSTPAALSFSLPFQTLTPESSSFILAGVAVLGLIRPKRSKKAALILSFLSMLTLSHYRVPNLVDLDMRTATF
jgi:hypothetical protein